jgi:hypothetical protein
MALKGSCHCGATRFEVDAAPESLSRCTCSYCSKHGALWAYYTPEQFHLAEPPQAQTTYRWRTKAVAHHFCPTCGCATFSESPDFSTGKPNFQKMRVGVSAHLLDDFDLAAVPVTVLDGKTLW